LALELTRQLIGFPRHLSQHVGGFVITESDLDTVIPIGNAAMDDRTFVEWDKDDLDALGILKIDVLALGMLTCIAKAFHLLADHYDRPLTLATIPPEDPSVYDMICRADTVGVFQIESRAQMSMLPRLKPRKFDDLVIEVAIVRPGPIQGDMVHPYLRCRDGIEKVTYPSKALEEVLGKTLGVPLFQEQAMKIAIVAAGFTPAESDRLRRAMATFRKVGIIHEFGTKLVNGMVANGYEKEFAERCFKQIEGFGEYGFPESHAASFALLVYVSCWLKHHYPDVFLTAMLNSQPLGFYAPAQLVRDARDHGVTVLPVDVNLSNWDATMEEEAPGKTHAVRLGLRQIKGFREDAAAALMAVREGGYDSVRDLWLRAGLRKDAMEKLAHADAFRSLGLDRREALWAVRALGDEPLPLFRSAASQGAEEEVLLPRMPLGEHVAHDYARLKLSLKAHPMDFLRQACALKGHIPIEGLQTAWNNSLVTLTGLVLLRQRPGTAKGVIFMTLEDETGAGNIIVWAKTFEAYRKVVLGSKLLTVRGRVQREGIVIHVIADHLEDASADLSLLTDGQVEGPQALARADEVVRAQEDPRNITARRVEVRAQRAAAIIPKSRDFH
jgi:error-prone DNA polymerase